MGHVPRGYQDDYLRCRAMGHSWEEFNPLEVPWTAAEMSGLYCESLRCTSCGMERYRQISRNTGAVYGERRYPPIGYSFSVDDRPSRDDFRLRRYKRARIASKSKRR